MDNKLDESLFDGGIAYKIELSLLESEISKVENIIIEERKNGDSECLKRITSHLINLRIIRDWRNG